MIEEKINELKGLLVEYSCHVVSMVEKSVQGIADRRERVLHDLLDKDEPRANNFEIEIDDKCTSLIIQLQPKAKDLRTILMILKMNNDLERIGDHAVNICQRALALDTHPLARSQHLDIPRMAYEAINMLNDGVRSFVDENASLAKSVCKRDSVVDELRDKTVRKLVNHMIKHPNTIERSIHLLEISKNLERIADLSTNICEDVIYLVDGRVIKHHHEE